MDLRENRVNQIALYLEPRCSLGAIGFQRAAAGLLAEEDLSDTVAEGHASDQWQDILSRAFRVLVVSDRRDEQWRKLPFFGERSADLSVIHTEFFLFKATKRRMICAGLSHELSVLIAEGLTHGDDAEVLEQTTDEGLFAPDGSEMLTQSTRCGRCIQTPPPIPDMVKTCVACFLQVGD